MEVARNEFVELKLIKCKRGFGIIKIIGLFTAVFSAIALVFIALGVARIFWLKIFYDEIPNLIPLDRALIFDYVIVGAGTAGTVLAAELSRKSNATVLLIEAGHTFGVFSKVPLLATLAQKTENDWAFLSTSQKHSSGGLIDNRQSLPRGKGLGGSSQLNYLLHYDGKKKDFENWKELGGEEWSYENIRSYMPYEPSPEIGCSQRHKFTQICPATVETEVPKIWKIPINYSKISEAFEEAGQEFQDHYHFRRTQYNVKNGRRWSVYEEFLRPSFELENLKILTNAVVSRIVFKDLTAKGVLITFTKGRNVQTGKVRARKEVILAAGAYHTPQILHLSGIGPQQMLKELGIPVVLDSPFVGKNLHDHFNMPLFVTINETASLTLPKILNIAEIWKYLTTGEGHFGNFGVIGQIIPKNSSFGLSIFATGAIDEGALMALSNFKQETFRSLFPFHYNSSQEGMVLLSNCLQPKSRGTVRASSRNIRHLPEVNPNYLSDSSDIDCTIQAIRAAVKIVSSQSFQGLSPKIHWPIFRECSEFGPFLSDFEDDQPSDLYLECIIKTAALGSHHPGGSCSIGKVVYNDLRVKGLKRIRIVDASVMPAPISGTPNSILIAIAKRAAVIILYDKM